MKKLNILAFGFLFLITGCESPRHDTVFQLSTIDALLAGVFEGDQSCSSLLKQGDQGIGTFNDLDGEMVVVEGKVYQVKADGKVYQPDPSLGTPFATICHFQNEIEFQLDSIADFPMIERMLNEKAPNQNLICAIKINGTFRAMKTRSVPRQHKPYPPLSVVTANQPEFRMENIEGTIVGFRFPPFVKGINMPGYHLHFISSDRTRGGHILSFDMVSGSCGIDILHQFFLKLPAESEAFAKIDHTRDRSVELQEVEGDTRR
jgi:acetolactate decarboxylase